MHQYYLKVVPTTYVFANGSGKEDEVSHQFSITRSEKDILAGASGIPGSSVSLFCSGSSSTPFRSIRAIWVFSTDGANGRAAEVGTMLTEFPFHVHHVFRSLSHYLVNLCAICGGVFTVASLVDSLIYSSSRAVQRKLQVGKAGWLKINDRYPTRLLLFVHSPSPLFFITLHHSCDILQPGIHCISPFSVLTGLSNFLSFSHYKAIFIPTRRDLVLQDCDIFVIYPPGRQSQDD